MKRFADIVSSMALLAVLGPPALLGALLIRITMGRPVFFHQLRSGLGGKLYVITKLRTMSVGRKHDPYEPVPLSHPQITPVGRLLRRLKLDEVPQLWSVLKGDMSLIGPRPALPEQVAAYDEFARRRLALRPGITGLAQINGGSSIPWDQRIKYDVYYIKHAHWLLDLKIILRTVLIVLMGEERFVRPFDEHSREALGKSCEPAEENS